MSAKVNPRRRPATESDVKKAFEAGKNAGINTILTAVLYVMQDKHGATEEELKRFNGEINYALDSIARGYVKIEDVWRMLGEEYDLHLEITG